MGFSPTFYHCYDAEYSIFNAAVGALRSPPHKMVYTCDREYRMPHEVIVQPFEGRFAVRFWAKTT